MITIGGRKVPPALDEEPNCLLRLLPPHISHATLIPFTHRRTGKERSAGFPRVSLATAGISEMISTICPSHAGGLDRGICGKSPGTTTSLSECHGEHNSDSGVEWLQYCAGEVLIVKGSDHTGWPVRQTSTNILSWDQGVLDQTRREAR